MMDQVRAPVGRGHLQALTTVSPQNKVKYWEVSQSFCQNSRRRFISAFELSFVLINPCWRKVGIYLFIEIVASYNDDDVYLFMADDPDGHDSIATYSGHRNNATVKGVNFYGPNSEYVVSGSDCGHVYLWDKQSRQAVQIQKGMWLERASLHTHIYSIYYMSFLCMVDSFIVVHICLCT